MSIADEITRLYGVREDIFSAIEDKGVTVPSGSKLDDAPDLIAAISGGGGNIPALGKVTVGGRDYPYVQYSGMLFTILNLDFIPEGSTIELGVNGAPETPAAWYYNNDEATYGWNGKQYGLLYNKYAIPEINAALTDGWHVMTFADNYNCMRQDMYYNTFNWQNANKYKDPNIAGWNGTGEMGFMVRPSGERTEAGVFTAIETQWRVWLYESANTTYRISTTPGEWTTGSQSKNAKYGCSLRLAKIP